MLGALSTAQTLTPAAIAEFSTETRNVIEPLALAARAIARFGPDAMGIYVISMTDDVSDLLEVELLQALAGAKLPIAPLFETLDDLDRAAPDLERVFLPARSGDAHASARDVGLFGQQQRLRLSHVELGALQGAGEHRSDVPGERR